jgi:hypothetical protein
MEYSRLEATSTEVAAGETAPGKLRIGVDRRLKLELHGSKVTLT